MPCYCSLVHSLSYLFLICSYLHSLLYRFSLFSSLFPISLTVFNFTYLFCHCNPFFPFSSFLISISCFQLKVIFSLPHSSSYLLSCLLFLTYFPIFLPYFIYLPSLFIYSLICFCPLIHSLPMYFAAYPFLFSTYSPHSHSQPLPLLPSLSPSHPFLFHFIHPHLHLTLSSPSPILPCYHFLPSPFSSTPTLPFPSLSLSHFFPPSSVPCALPHFRSLPHFPSSPFSPLPPLPAQRER